MSGAALREAMAARLADPELAAEFKRRGMKIKRSAKGGVSVYGLNRFPVTLYKSQWIKLLRMAPIILAFIDLFDSCLPEKPTK